MLEPCLQWVKHNEEVCHISNFEHLPPNKRPEVFCPVCNQPVLLKLGAVRIHHVAHYEGATCVATQPETAIHLNAKYHIQKELTLKKGLKVWQYCKGWNNGNYMHACANKNKHETTLLETWNNVEVECWYDKYRLDVALLENSRVVGAVEVLVTHQSETQKINFLNQQKVAWAEIEVSQSFYTPPDDWEADFPLETFRHNQLLSKDWQCEECLSKRKEHLKKVENQNLFLEEKERKRLFAQQFETKFIRIVDFYYPSGKKYRSIYIIQTKSSNGKIAYAELQEIGTNREKLRVAYPPISDKSFEILKSSLNEILKEKNKKNDWIIDASRDWFPKPNKHHPKKLIDEDIYPFNFEWINNKWERYSHYFNPKQYHEKIGVQNTAKEYISLFLQTGQCPCVRCGQLTSDWHHFFEETKTCICRGCAKTQK